VLAQYRDGLGQPEIKPQLLARPTYFATASAAGVPSSHASTQTAKLDDGAVGSTQEGSAVQVGAIIRSDLITTVVGAHPAPPATLPVEPPAPPALVWGHWSQPVGSGDFSEPFRVASIGREVTVGNGSHVLYRSLPADGAASSIQPSLGQVGFTLQQASAQFRPWGGVDQDAVAHSGVLTIDFAARQYQTSLQLGNAIAGNHTLASSGIVLSDGIFGGASGGQKVIGAATLDGKGAGYFFDKTVETGAFSGITLWAK